MDDDTRRSTRITGIDLARALALIGMLAVHLGPEDVPDLFGRLYALGHGRASILFIVVAGVGITLLSSGTLSSTDARMRLLWYAAVLLPLGLVLQVLDHPVAVILQHYAAFFVFGACVLGLETKRLLWLAITLTVVGPLLYWCGRLAEPALFSRASVSARNSPLTIVAGLLISGPYPLLTWSAPLLWGIWLGRQDLRSSGVRRALCLIGASVAVASASLSMALVAFFGGPMWRTDWRIVLVDTAHSQMPLWIMNSTGAAVFMLGASLVFADRFPRLARPFVMLGQMSLSIYVMHLLLLHFSGRLLIHDAVLPAVITVAALTFGGIVFSYCWRSLLARGPIETLMHLPWRLMARRRLDH